MGRKSLKDEIQVVKYMTDLSKPTFDYLMLCITSGDKEDKQWAIEQMMKLYPKAIPQEFDPENSFPVTITGINYIVPNGANPTTDTQTASSLSSPEQSVS
jgi:hypothetical protein